MKMIDIVSNGSKWAGEQPDSIDTLIEVLDNTPLHREMFRGRFIERDRVTGVVRFFGNFQKVPHVFRIYTDEPAIIRQLSCAIRRNRQRPDYRSQPRGRNN